MWTAVRCGRRLLLKICANLWILPGAALFVALEGPEEETVEDARARCSLGFRSKLYAEDVGTLHRWCRGHRIRLTGHMDQRNGQPNSLFPATPCW